MKILFVDYQHMPMPDANGNCVEGLRRRMKREGVETDVLTFRLKRSTPTESKDECGTLYSEPTWANLMTTGRTAGDAGWRIALRFPAAAAARVAHRVISSRYAVSEKTFSPKACRRFRRRLERLCAQNSYDWVVAVSSPFCVHEIACSAELSGARLALYYLDPYSNHALFSKENQATRIKEELATVGKAEAVFASLEHERDWRASPLCAYTDKVHFIPYPNLFPYQGEVQPSSIPMNSEDVNIVYLGALHDGVRYPQAMLELFDAMLKLEPRMRLYIIGVRSGAKVLAQIAEAQRRFATRLLCHNAIPFPQAMDMIVRADYVVNLGNRMANQMPSKLLDYIAAGKPILNISPNRPCNTEPYISRYPWAQQCYDDELRSPQREAEIAERAISFIHEHAGSSLPWPRVEAAMAGFTAEDVAKIFLDVLNQARTR